MPPTQAAVQAAAQASVQASDDDVQAPLCLALFQPDIPQNAGTMLRLCACLGLDAAIVEPAGFPVSDRDFRRAGMDYLDLARIARHSSWRAFEDWRATTNRRLVLLTTHAATAYADFAFRRGDIVMVGRESAGVPDEVRAAADATLRIPMRANMRSLNVAVAAAMVLGEALRQTDGFAQKGFGKEGLS
jgi:tRNA (cytidine/uridine-2'-O-)-methyltransferase